MRSFSLELRYTLFSFELSEFLELGFFVKRSFYFRKNPFALSFPPFGEIVVFTLRYWKDLKNSIDLVFNVLYICSFSLMFFSYSIFNDHIPHLSGWSVWMDSNHRPRAYQARALTT